MRYFHPLPVARFPTRAVDVFGAGIVGATLGILGEALAVPFPGVAVGASVLLWGSVLVLAIGAVGFAVRPESDAPLLDLRAPPSRDDIEARLATATEQLGVFMDPRGTRGLPLILAVHAAPGGMMLRIFVPGSEGEFPDALFAHLARKVASDGITAHAFRRAIPSASLATHGTVRIQTRTDTFSAHRRFAHLRDLTDAGLIRAGQL